MGLNMLRVTAGSLGGLKLEVPRGPHVRPPLQMIREAVFNILGQDLAGWRVADLFAGSGIMGIEALSRGAEHVVFIERNRDAVALITRNLEKAHFLDCARVVAGDALAAPARLSGRGPVDLVFLDPPFKMMERAHTRRPVNDLVARLFECGKLAPDAVVMLRVPTRSDACVPPEGVELFDERVYGVSRLLFFEKRLAPEQESPMDRDQTHPEKDAACDGP